MTTTDVLFFEHPGQEGSVGDEGDPREILNKWTRDKAARQ